MQFSFLLFMYLWHHAQGAPAEFKGICQGNSSNNGKDCEKGPESSPCPRNHIMSPEGCQPVQELEPEAECPPSYVFNKTTNTCTNSTTKNPMRYASIATSECSVEYSCPPNSTSNGKECVINTLVPPEIERRSTRHTCSTIEKCPAGYRAVNDSPEMCERVNEKVKLGQSITSIVDCDIEYECPKGSKKVGGECIQVTMARKTSRSKSRLQKCELKTYCGANEVDTGTECEVRSLTPALPSLSKEEVSMLEKREAPFLVAATYSCDMGGVLDEATRQCTWVEKKKKVSKMEIMMDKCGMRKGCAAPYEYLEKEGKCVMKEVMSASNTTTKREVSCLKERICPLGYVMDGVTGECYYEHNVPATVVTSQKTEYCAVTYECPADSQDLGGEKCLTNKKVTPKKNCQFRKLTEEVECVMECAEGYELHASGVCVAQQLVPPRYQCRGEEDCTFDSGKKECSRVRFLSQSTCPQGFRLVPGAEVGQECVKREVVPMISVCSKGCVGMEDGKCVKFETDFVFECPEGFTKMDGKEEECVRVTEMPVEERCEKPCVFNAEENSCIQMQLEAKEECEMGSQMVDGMCVRIRKEDAMVTCPRGYSYNLHLLRCQKEEIYSYRCGNNMDPIFNLATKQYYCPVIQTRPYKNTCPVDCHYINDKQKNAFSCYQLETLLDETCPEGFEDIGNECVRKVKVPEIAICPNECFFSSKDNKEGLSKCIKKENTFEYYCPKGYQDQGNVCTATNYVPKISICPEGCSRDKSGDCSTAEMLTTMKCPEGSIEVPAAQDTDSAFIFSPSGDMEGKGLQCVIEKKSSLVPKCPKDCLTQNRWDGSLRIGCVRIERQHHVNCSSGYYLDNGTGKCINEKVVPPELKCPTGYSLDMQDSICRI